jgi:hypothetical protein
VHERDVVDDGRAGRARDGDRLERGLVLIAPGGRHLHLRKAAGQYYAVVSDGPAVNRHRPSVDVLFKSTAECAGRDALGLLLTGYRQRDRQKKALAELGVQFRSRPADGFPLVIRSQFESKGRQGREPDFAAVGG